MGPIVFWLVVLAVVVGTVAATIVTGRRRRRQVEAALTAPGAASAHTQLARGGRAVVPQERGKAYRSLGGGEGS